VLSGITFDSIAGEAWRAELFRRISTTFSDYPDMHQKRNEPDEQEGEFRPMKRSS